MENVTLQRVKSNACRTYEVPAGKLATNIKNYGARDYARYERYGYPKRPPDSKSDWTYSKFVAFLLIWAKRFFMDFTGAWHLTCGPRKCTIQVISDHLST